MVPVLRHFDSETRARCRHFDKAVGGIRRSGKFSARGKLITVQNCKRKQLPLGLAPVVPPAVTVVSTLFDPRAPAAKKFGAKNLAGVPDQLRHTHSVQGISGSVPDCPDQNFETAAAGRLANFFVVLPH